MDRKKKNRETANHETANQNSLLVLYFLQGALIGLGAVLPGISGGVLSVVFGVYRPIMELLSHPGPAMKKYYRMLIPIILGGGFGFVVVARILGFLLTRYPDPSVCLFAGLIMGMLPSLFREAGKKGREKKDMQMTVLCFMLVLTLLLSLHVVRVSIEPSFFWYLFCGFCIALSVIAPGMSFSTLLMPLGLYTPLVEGIGRLDMAVLLPAGIGAFFTVLLLARAVTALMEKHYARVFHGIIGIVMAATLVIIPFRSFTVSILSCVNNLLCLSAGIVAALLLDQFNRKIEVPET